jgi:hypothetical protein
MLTDTELKRAALALCAKRNQDPDQMVPFNNGTAAYTTRPRWKSMYQELQLHDERSSVLAQAARGCYESS